MNKKLTILFLELALCLNLISSWDYSQSGLNWGGSCASTDTNQSPINIDKPFSFEVPSIQFHYSVVAGVPLKNNGNNLYLQADLGYVKYKKDIFSAQEIIFHSPSQHTFGPKNKRFDLQMQIIHSSVDQKSLIVSVLFTTSQDEPGLFLEKLGMNQESMKLLDKGHQFLTSKAIDLDSLLQNTQRYVAYQGSSTRPNCEGPSTWIIIMDTIKASKYQISNFPQKLKNASRAVQPKHDRQLRVSVEQIDKQQSKKKAISNSKAKDNIGNRKKIFEKVFWDNYLIEKQIEEGNKETEAQRKQTIPQYDLDFPKFGVVSRDDDEDADKMKSKKNGQKQQQPKKQLSKQQKELFKDHNLQYTHQIFNDKPDRLRNQINAEVMNDGTYSKLKQISFQQLTKQSQSQFMNNFINGEDSSSQKESSSTSKAPQTTGYSLLQLSKQQVTLGKLAKQNIDYFHTNDWPIQCNHGNNQSPVNIKAPFYPSPNSLSLMYQAVKEEELQIFNDGGYKIVVRGNFGKTKFGSHLFAAVQLNLHKPSEHTFGENGVHSAFEMQIISKDTAGGVMALAILFDEKDDEGSEFLQNLGLGLTGVVPKLHQAGDRTKLMAKSLDLGKYIGNIEHFITYEGSLTSPPCHQGVQWFIAMKKFNISKMQLNTFQQMIGKPNNVRSVNGLNGRILREI